MALKLEIPEADWPRLIHERISKSNGQQASNAPVVSCYSHRTLTGIPYDWLTYKEDGDAAITEPLSEKLAEVMVSDKMGELPTILWKGDKMEAPKDLGDITKPICDLEKMKRREVLRVLAESIRDKNKMETGKVRGDGAAQWICDLDKNDLVHERLEKENWTKMICGKSGTFTVLELLPVDQGNNGLEKELEEKTEERTMAGLAQEVGKICHLHKFLHIGNVRMANMYRDLILDLGKAATECSDLKAYIRISLFLFLVVDGLNLAMDLEVTSEEQKRLKAIGCEYLRNYVALVLLGEELLAPGDIQKEEQPAM